MDNEKVTVDVERLRRDIEANIECLCRALFPSGEKAGREWCIADTSGNKGKSLKIELVTVGKKGLYQDWATGHTGDFIKLIKERYGICFSEVARKIAGVLGTDYFLSRDRTAGTSKAHCKTTQEPKPPATINWTRHVEELKLCPDPLLVQSANRKWSQEFCAHLLEHELIGSYEGNLAFPSFQGGSVVAMHVRPNDPSKDWFYLPAGLIHGIYATNDPCGAKRAVVAESYWDLFSYLDLTNLYRDDDTAGLCTRGANGQSRVDGLITSQSQVIILAQNDPPGQNWLEKVRELIGRPVLSVQCPAGIKDFSDWRSSGATPEQVQAATLELETLQPKPDSQSSRQQAHEEKQPRELRKLCGASIIDYAQRNIDMSQSLLGNRWLSRKRGAFVIAPSGHGKSSFAIQTAICWACSRAAFAIKPNIPFRTLIVQSEDDDNDVIEMAQMCERMELTKAERDLVQHNTHIELLDDAVGQQFFSALDDFLTQYPADLLMINPYQAYQGGELTDDKLNNQFLRQRLSRRLNEHNCAALVIHHTPKTTYQNVDAYSWYDWMDQMAGGAALTNWARAILVIAPSKIPGTYRFIAAKRYEKIQWQQREYWFSHSVEDAIPLWVPSSQEQILLAGKNKKPGAEEVLSKIPVLDPILQEKLYEIMNHPPFNLGIDAIKRAVRLLLAEEKIFKHPSHVRVLKALSVTPKLSPPISMDNVNDPPIHILFRYCHPQCEWNVNDPMIFIRQKTP
jgi:hypothetical protein